MTENRASLLVLALVVVAVVLTFCSQWHAANVVLWAVATAQSFRVLRFLMEREKR